MAVLTSGPRAATLSAVGRILGRSGLSLLVTAALTAGLLAACQRSEGAPEPKPAVDAGPAAAEPTPPDEPLPWDMLPMLPTDSAPRGWGRAHQTWHTATVAYSRGDLRLAAEGFFSVAEILREKPQLGVEGRVASAARCIAYENAALSMRLDDRADEAIEALERAAVADPSCAYSIRGRIARLTRTSTRAADDEGEDEPEVIAPGPAPGRPPPPPVR